jgi:hypothetical protein
MKIICLTISLDLTGGASKISCNKTTPKGCKEFQQDELDTQINNGAPMTVIMLTRNPNTLTSKVKAFENGGQVTTHDE